MTTSMRSKVPLFLLSAVAAALATTLAASVTALAILASILPAEASQPARIEMAASGAKFSAGPINPAGTSGKLACKGAICAGSHAGERGPITGTAGKGDPNPVVRDHRGGAGGGGGVTVTEGKPRPRGGGLCAGWFC
jgi:hypothetical protein